jgi:hypothetical protein
LVFSSLYPVYSADRDRASVCERLVRPFEMLLSLAAPLHQLGERQEHQVRDTSLADPGAFDTLFKHGFLLHSFVIFVFRECTSVRQCDVQISLLLIVIPDFE